MTVARKRKAAAAALKWIRPSEVLGIGTGSTVDALLELFAESPALRPMAAVSTSPRTSAKLAEIGIAELPLAEVQSLALYIDGADEIDPQLRMIKGGGGALTREKIVAECADRFICIADASKLRATLGRFPLPLEVLPVATRLIERKLAGLGADGRVREGFVSDHGNLIIDIQGLVIDDPVAVEMDLSQWPGVVCCGLFARRPADIALIADYDQVLEIKRSTP